MRSRVSPSPYLQELPRTGEECSRFGRRSNQYNLPKEWRAEVEEKRLQINLYQQGEPRLDSSEGRALTNADDEINSPRCFPMFCDRHLCILTIN